jgi:hypothetical protein
MRSLNNKGKGMQISAAQRNNMVSFANWLVTHKENIRWHDEFINYAEIRPMKFWSLTELEVMFSNNKDITMDCSWSVAEICYETGLESPSGPSYPYSGGEGNTTTIFDYLPHITFAEAKAGDLVGFVAGPGPAHVTMITEPNGDNPTLFSHGYEGGPFILPLNQESPNHPHQEVIVLSVENLSATAPPKPVVDKPKGVAHFSGSVDFDTGNWTIEGIQADGAVKFGGPSEWWSAEIQIQGGNIKGAGDWRIKDLPANAKPLGE